jgi:hypothetical protein
MFSSLILHVKCSPLSDPSSQHTHRGRATAFTAKRASYRVLGGLALFAAGTVWAAQGAHFDTPTLCSAGKAPFTGVPGTDKVRLYGFHALETL